jgi:hypothetical protein
LITLLLATRADAQGVEEVVATAAVLTEIVGDLLVRSRESSASSEERLTAAEASRTQLADQLQSSEQRLSEIVGSRSYRASRLLGRSLGAFRRSTPSRGI